MAGAFQLVAKSTGFEPGQQFAKGKVNCSICVFPDSEK